MSPRFGLVGPSYEAQSPNLDAQKCVNWYVEADESGAGNAPIALMPTPGTKRFDKPSAFGIQNTLVELSAAQLKTAFATSLILIPAPSATNHAIVPLSATIQLNFNGVAYTIDCNPTIGFGTTPLDVFDNGWMMYPNQGRLQPFMKQAGTNICFTSVTDSGQAAGAFDPTTHIVNQPLVWANGTDISADAGNSSITMNIQWIEVDVTTGIIYNGIGNTVHGAMVNLTRAQLNSSSVLQVVPTPGVGLTVIPISMEVWFHGATTITDLFQVQPPVDHFYLQSNVYPLIVAAQMVNQPLNYAYLGGTSLPFPRQIGYGGATPTDVLNVGVFDVHKSDVDDTNGATFYIQYLVLDIATGELKKAGVTGGDATYSFTNLSNAQLKSAHVTPITLAAAPGAGKLCYPLSYVVNSKFNTTAFPQVAGEFPNPSVGTGLDSAFLDFQYFMAPNFLGTSTALFTANAAQIALGTPQNAQAVGDCTVAETVNAPIGWGETNDLSAQPADSSGDACIQFIVVDLTNGNVTSNPGIL